MNEIPNWLQNRAFLTPDRIAVKYNGESITFLDLHNRVVKVANHLSTLGIKENDMVSILMKNSVKMVELIHALMYIGAVTVFLNSKLTKNELRWQIQDSDSTFLITESRFNEELGSLHSNTILVENLEEKESTTKAAIKELFQLDRPNSIMYTSGTTGKPKGVVQTYGNHWSSAIGSVLNLGLQQNDCWLAAVPFFHISGLSILIRSVVYGIPVVIFDGFNAQEVNHSIINEKVTIISVVSAMLTQLVADLRDDSYPDTFRCMLLGGGPAPKPLLELCKEKGIPVYQTYGMTETSSQIVTLSPEYSLSKLGSAGKPLFPCQIRIEKNGNSLEAYEHGEIVVKGPNVTMGYYKREDATAKALVDGWLYTGDIGYLDEEGFLFVLDRRNDLIISGGENIYPAEVESVLLSHPSIIDAGVIGRESEKWGQVPVAFIKVNKTASLSSNDVILYCKERLAKYKVPTEVFFIEELPRNASNKILRRKLVDILKQKVQL